MGIPLDLETSIALACAASLALILCLVVYAVSDGASGRRFKRRLARVRDRAKGVVSVEAALTRSLARQQSATPRIDRIARQWLPRRDMLAHRLAPTGRRISVRHHRIPTAALPAPAPTASPFPTPLALFPPLSL